MENKYGYKICYQENNKQKLKVHFVADTYQHAAASKNYYDKYETHDRDTNKLLLNVRWYILPILTYKEFKKLKDWSQF